MADNYTKGFAFVFEGDTEKEFYFVLLEYLCQKHGAALERKVNPEENEILYELTTGDGSCCIIKTNTVNTISQVTNAGQWFNTQCANKYKTSEWRVFLCYDTDNYKEDISKFYEGDWSALRDSLKNAESITDIAAAADIEDIMLQDLPHICGYLKCNLVNPNSLRGRKGKVKMKNLFRDHGQAYHEGKRARAVIEALDMGFLLENSIAPLKEIENQIFNCQPDQ